MSAAPQLAPGMEAEQPPAPAQEAPKPVSLNEALTGAPTPEAPKQPESLRETEARLEREGMAKVNELGKNLNLQAEQGAQQFKEETKGWWGRAKGFFKKTETAPAKGEDEILKEVEKADAAYATFKAKYEEIMSSGDQAGLQMLERSLSKAYEDLAPQVAAEGAAESKAWKQALKTGEAPPTTVAGAKLNDVARRLQEVRGRLAVPEAQAASEVSPATETPQAEAAPTAAEAAPTAAEAAPTAPGASEAPSAESTEELLERLSPSDREEAEILLYGKKLQVGKGYFGKQDKGREGLFANEEKGRKGFFAREGTGKVSKGLFGKKEWTGGIAGTPAEALLGTYLRAKGSVGKKDAYGEVVGVALDAQKAEVHVKYADGTEIRTYPDGKVLRVLRGGKATEPWPPAPAAEAPQAAPEAAPSLSEEPPAPAAEEGTDENPMMLTPEMRKVSTEGVVSGEVEAKPAPEEKPVEPSVVVESLVPKTSEGAKVVSGEIETPTVLQRKKTSEDAPTASGEFETPEPPKPKTPQERYPNLPKPAPGSRPPGVPDTRPPAPTEIPSAPETQSVPETPAPASVEPESAEKEDFPMDKVDASLADVAEKVLLPLAKASETPKTYGSKVVGKMAPAAFLKIFVDAGKISAEESAALAEEFKTDPESFNAARKKAVAALNKLAR